jgi:DNA sulfur modification protein DndB
MGNTTFYQLMMPARELVTGVRPAKELDEWANFSIEEKMQRELNTKRIRDEIAPYLARSKDRFFGSLIVLAWHSKVAFESLADVNVKLPNAYKSAIEGIGFVTIDGGHLIALDGQHRLVSLEQVVKHDVVGSEAMSVADDDISVILIEWENNEKTRRIFNKVNRYRTSP